MSKMAYAVVSVVCLLCISCLVFVLIEAKDTIEANCFWKVRGQIIGLYADAKNGDPAAMKLVEALKGYKFKNEEVDRMLKVESK
jgi:hypothetical protein